jgi:hypothetical protein
VFSMTDPYGRILDFLDWSCRINYNINCYRLKIGKAILAKGRGGP